MIWTNSLESCCWRLETRVVPTDLGIVALTSVVPYDRDAVPLAAQPPPPAAQAIEADVVAFVKRCYEEAATWPLLQALGFSESALHQVIRPRGNPKTPEVVYAAVAVLWETCPSRRALSGRLGLGDIRSLIKSWTDGARRREYLEPVGHGRRGGRATSTAHNLLENDGREPEAILASWLQDRR